MQDSLNVDPKYYMMQNKKSIDSIKRKLTTAFKNIIGSNEDSNFELFATRNIDRSSFSVPVENKSDQDFVKINSSLTSDNKKNDSITELLFEKPNFKIDKISVDNLKLDSQSIEKKIEKENFSESRNSVENNNRYTNNNSNINSGSFRFNPVNPYPPSQFLPAVDFNQYYNPANYFPISSGYMLNNFFQSFINQLFPAMIQQYANNLIGNAINQNLLYQNQQKINSLSTNEIVSNIESSHVPSPANLQNSYNKYNFTNNSPHNVLSIDDINAFKNEIRSLISESLRDASYSKTPLRNIVNDRVSENHRVDDTFSSAQNEEIARESMAIANERKNLMNSFEKERVYINDAINYLEQKSSLINDLYDKIENQESKIDALKKKLDEKSVKDDSLVDANYEFDKKNFSENKNEKILETQEIVLPKESFWKKYIGDYRYGMYDKNNNWQWKGFFDERGAWHYYENRNAYEYDDEVSQEIDSSEIPYLTDELEASTDFNSSIDFNSPQFYRLVGDYESIDNVNSPSEYSSYEEQSESQPESEQEDFVDASDLELEIKDSDVY